LQRALQDLQQHTIPDQNQEVFLCSRTYFQRIRIRKKKAKNNKEVDKKTELPMKKIKRKNNLQKDQTVVKHSSKLNRFLRTKAKVL
jgi:hypothetical protein